MTGLVLPDIVLAGIYRSDVFYKNVSVSKKRRTTLFELEIPLENVGVSHMDAEQCPVHSATVICAKPNQLRYTELPYSCRYLHFRLGEGTLAEKLNAMPDFIPVNNREYYHDLFGKIARGFEGKTENDFLLMQSAFLELVVALEKESVKQKRVFYYKSGNKEVIDRLLSYIRAHLEGDLRLETLAQMVSLSPVYLHKVFREAVGENLREYVEDQRLKKAVQLLLGTNLTLEEIAFRCGFSSQSYFSYVFKRKMKMPPRAYVKKRYGQYSL